MKKIITATLLCLTTAFASEINDKESMDNCTGHVTLIKGTEITTLIEGTKITSTPTGICLDGVSMGREINCNSPNYNGVLRTDPPHLQ